MSSVDDTYDALKRRIEAFTAKKTPLSEPGREIENAVDEHIKIPMFKLLDGNNTAVFQIRPAIIGLRKLFQNNNTFRSNHRVSNNTCTRLANEAEALLNDILTFRQYANMPSKRARLTRKQRKTRKTRKTRR